MKFVPNSYSMQIRPNSIWLVYDMRRKDSVRRMIPERMRLATPRILRSDPVVQPSPKIMFNIYGVDSLFMRGTRVEVVTIAQSCTSQHFVVLDCLSDTFKWDPITGIALGDATCRTRVSTFDVSHATRGRNGACLEFDGILRRLDRPCAEFAVDANRVCYYKNHPIGYEMDFDPQNVLRNVRRIFPTRINNTIWSDYCGALTHSFMHIDPMEFRVRA